MVNGRLNAALVLGASFRRDLGQEVGEPGCLGQGFVGRVQQLPHWRHQGIRRHLGEKKLP